MPPDGYYTITVSDEVFQQVIAVMTEHECESVADAVSSGPQWPAEALHERQLSPDSDRTADTF